MTQEDRRKGAPRQETDRVPVGRLVAAGAIVVAATAGSLVWAWLYAASPAATPDGPGAGERLDRAVRDLRGTIFPRDAQSRLGTLRGHPRLEGYAWVDRDGELVRIPIREAMRLIAEEGP